MKLYLFSRARTAGKETEEIVKAITSYFVVLSKVHYSKETNGKRNEAMGQKGASALKKDDLTPKRTAIYRINFITE